MDHSVSKSFLQRWEVSRWFPAISSLACALLAGSLVAAPVPTTKPASYPSWWFEREVIPQKTQPPLTAPAWPTNYSTADDFAAANLGQLKQVATAAYDELGARLPGGAGSDAATLVKGWFQLDGSGNFALDSQGHRQPRTTAPTDNFAAVNLGQLKAVAKFFYDRLTAVHYTNAYPWANSGADDFAIVNLGQLKRVFSFDLRSVTLINDVDQNGLPDWWELAYFGQTGLDPNALAPSGDGLTLLQKFQRGTDPDAFETVPLDQQSPIRLKVFTRLE